MPHHPKAEILGYDNPVSHVERDCERRPADAVALGDVLQYDLGDCRQLNGGEKSRRQSPRPSLVELAEADTSCLIMLPDEQIGDDK